MRSEPFVTRALWSFKAIKPLEVLASFEIASLILWGVSAAVLASATTSEVIVAVVKRASWQRLFKCFLTNQALWRLKPFQSLLA